MTKETWATVQVKLCVALLPELSVAVTLTVYGLLVSAPRAIVPEITPLPLLMVRPDGKPVAEYVSVLLSLSLADTGKDTLSPTALLWLLMEPTDTTASTVQLKVWLLVFVPSVAVTVTEEGLSVSAVPEIVPVICPVVLLMLSPVGRPVAL